MLGRFGGFLAGILGAAVALGFGELIDGISESIPSLVIAVGEVVTDYTPGDVVAFSIANIGDGQKTLLTAGVVVLSLAICGLLGRFAVGGRPAIAVGGYALFGLVGGWAAARNPLSPAVTSWIVALAAAVLGAATTLFLASRAARALRPVAAAGPDPEPDVDPVPAPPVLGGSRRSFFAYASGAAVAALGLIGLGRGLRGESVAEQARAAYTLPSRGPEGGTGEDTPFGQGMATDQTGAGEDIPFGQGMADPTGTEPAPAAGAGQGSGTAGSPAAEPELAQPDDPELSAPTTSQQQEQVAGTEEPATDPTESAPTTTQAPEQSAPTTTEPEPAPTTTQQTVEQPAPTTTQAPEPEPAPTTTQQTVEQPAPTTTQAPEPEPAPTTTEAPEPEPAPTTTQAPEPEPAPTTTQPPKNLSVQQQLARIDTLDDEVAGISPYITPITPTDQFYRIDTALRIPQVDPSRWTLRFTGLVDRPYTLTFDDILSMDLSDHIITLSCVSNPVGGQLVGNAMWTGVPLAPLLERAGAQRRANQVVGRSVDDFTAGFPTGLVNDGRNAILAIGMNNELLPTAHGFPARLVVAGLYGYVSAVKWLDEIHLTTWDGFDGYWIPRGWSKRGPIKTQSRIDLPKKDARVKVGEPVSVAGIAWAPTRGIDRVEVKLGQDDWVECRLGQALGDESWVQWHREWIPDRTGTQTIQVRATDGTGTTQGGYRVGAHPNGAEGWHSVKVSVRR